VSKAESWEDVIQLCENSLSSEQWLLTAGWWRRSEHIEKGYNESKTLEKVYTLE